MSQTTFVTLASLLGIGVLGLPYVFAQIGWVRAPRPPASVPPSSPRHCSSTRRSSTTGRAAQVPAISLLLLFAIGGIYSGLLLCRLYQFVGTPR